MSDQQPANGGHGAANNKRRRQLTLLGGAVAVGLLGYGAWWLAFDSHYVETDDAYVGAETAQVTALSPGPVAKIFVVETQAVKAGDPLVIIDDADARIAVAQAEAALGQAERKVKGYFASDTALAGQFEARQADVARADAQIVAAKADVDRARVDLSRRQALVGEGAVSGDELTTAQNRLANAQAALNAAQAGRAQALASRDAAIGTREVNTVLISGVSVTENPEVKAAQARLDAARLALARTVVRAPTDGVVARKSVQVGQQVAMGTPMMAVVPTAQAYVDANFKEVQLDKVVPGQPVVLTSDLYGGGVKFHGKVRGLAGGTGSAFSLIPAQNASGNWIKVVQRVPVRITLDPAELAKHPLRVGLSMKAKIDVAEGAK
ncbi:HlyD family efflux transporter periplasmic adaptor subunit [Caulobacter sp. 602-1]|uniref:HlyD family secretion protein n=1 Tax=Caulobacter sp. 602-1 TaxID=2492472 RepID=UPI000F6324E2|nr:HlyD family efflux transporter periplasmic adaptor subunit [Caulobacter sp. 602-1]RRN62901.1 HlyD family efflux transporter periplasmic adaptor subunit [Caulobacter sp. 602-1]